MSIMIRAAFKRNNYNMSNEDYFPYYFACLDSIAIGLALLLGFVLIYCHAKHIEAEKTEGEVVV